MRLHLARVLAFLVPLAALLPATRAQAIDDRDNTAKTAWRAYAGQTFGDIQTTVAAGYRIVDIKTDDPFGTRFSTSYVQNAGAYNQSWWYQIDVDLAALSSYMLVNSLRPTKIICWDGGFRGTRFAAILTPNTGANHKTFWWYFGVSNQALLNSCTTNGARLVSWDEYAIGPVTYAVGVMIANTGADYRPWWMYWNQSVGSLGVLLGQNQARLYAMQQNPWGTFNAIMVRDTVAPWWYWTGSTAGGILDLANQWGARVIDFQNVRGICHAIFVNDTTPLERRVADLMGSTTNGSYGFYLKRVNGPVLAALQGDRIFEPASTLKTLIHFHAMREVQQNRAALTDLMTVYTGLVGTCPVLLSPVVENLDVVLRRMMEVSDNNRTLSAADRFGVGNINATALALGMNGTWINHTIGCGGPVPNQLTLADIGRLHEAVANGALGSARGAFYELMLEFGNSYALGQLDTVIAQEGASVGLTATQLAGFQANCRQAFKGGSYSLFPSREYRTWGSWLSLPFYTSAGIVAQEYVTGSFVDSGSNASNAVAAASRGAAEVLREEVRAAMLSWRDHVSGYFALIGGGCAGFRVPIPHHTGTSAAPEPNIGTQITWTLQAARTNSVAVLHLGASDSAWGSLRLPLNLAFVGMPNCTLYVSPDTSFGFSTGRGGGFDLTFTIPNDAALIGSHNYTQVAIADPSANALGIAWSNAMDTVPGGQR